MLPVAVSQFKGCSLWRISWLCHQMFPLLPLCHNFYCPGPLLFWAQRILGSGRPRRIVAVYPPKRGKRRTHLWAAFGGAFELGQPSCSVVTQLAFKYGLRRMQPLNWDTATVSVSITKICGIPPISCLTQNTPVG